MLFINDNSHTVNVKVVAIFLKNFYRHFLKFIHDTFYLFTASHFTNVFFQ
jgi:hypothetical protein